MVAWRKQQEQAGVCCNIILYYFLPLKTTKKRQFILYLAYKKLKPRRDAGPHNVQINFKLVINACTLFRPVPFPELYPSPPFVFHISSSLTAPLFLLLLHFATVVTSFYYNETVQQSHPMYTFAAYSNTITLPISFFPPAMNHIPHQSR